MVENGDQVLLIVDDFYLLFFDLKRGVCRGFPPEVYHQFFGVADIEKQTVLVAPLHQILHYGPVSAFFFGNLSRQGRVFWELQLQDPLITTSAVRSVECKEGKW